MPDAVQVGAYPVIEILVPGDPVGKARHRTAMRRDGSGLVHYTPRATRDWEGLVRGLAVDAMLRAGQRDARGWPKPFEAPMHLTLSIVLAVPASWPEWKRKLALDWELEPTVKPDDDNIEKSIKDALNGVVWRDDAQVTTSIIGKRYGSEPGVKVQAVPRMTYPAQISRRPNK